MESYNMGTEMSAKFAELFSDYRIHPIMTTVSTPIIRGAIKDATFVPAPNSTRI
jgi:hypothetical protein